MRIIDTRIQRADVELQRLRRSLSLAGDVVTEDSKARTMAVFGEPLTPRQVVERITSDVRQQGLPALLNYLEKVDRVSLTKEQLRVPASALDEAHRSVSAEYLQTIRHIRDRIFKYQHAIRHQDYRIENAEEDLRVVYRPIRRVGICVPGGAAAYPSTLLMTAIPAQAAGVKEIVVMAPPTARGAYNPHVLSACRELGIHEIYRMGGAHGVAALAYGVDGIAPVDMIVGPGNMFVALAKQRVSEVVGIDSFAGPSEIIVLADHSADAACVAADLIAQAEHAPGSSVLVTWDDSLVASVQAEMGRQLADLPRSHEASHSLASFGAIIMVPNEQTGCDLVNELAPEHLEIMTIDPESTLQKIDRAGAVFLGRNTPVAIGDYFAGPSHTLPTGGHARFASVLSANTFLRSMSVVAFSSDQLRASIPFVDEMACVEELTAHAQSLHQRFPKTQKPLEPNN
jgi:histidinol dehydrogenase